MVETRTPSAAGVFRFGVFQVNLPARELRKHGVRVRMHGQPFCILSLLLEQPGEVVTRQAMRERLWTSDTFVDFEHGLNSSMKKLRAALGDSAENPRYIETIPRVGYRFIAPVEQVGPITPQPQEVSVSATVEPISNRAAAFKVPSLTVVIASLCILTMALAYFGVSQLRTSSQVKGGAVGASPALLEAHPPARRQPVSAANSAEAHDLYLKGMHLWNQRTVTGLRQAVECFQRASTLDPNNSLAYSGLANSYTLLTAYSAVSATLYVPQARAAATRALELAPNSAEAHTAMALILQNHDWDWDISEKEFRRAVELDPNYATAHQWYAEHLMWLGRFDEALAEGQRARDLDPLSLIIATDYATIYLYSRQYDRAIAELRRVLQKDAKFPRAVGLLIESYVEDGQFDKAIAEAKVSRELYGDGIVYWQQLTYIYGRAGQLQQAQHEMDKIEKLTSHDPLDAPTLFSAHIGIGNKEEALADLERAYAEHSNFMTSLKVEPTLDPLRSDPRFQDLLRRVHLAQ